MKLRILLLCLLTTRMLSAQTHVPVYNFAKSLKGSTSTGIGLAIIEDRFRNVYLGGSFGATTDFDPGSGTTNLLSSGSGDAFIAKYDSLGNLLWVVPFTGGSSYEEIQSLKVDSIGNVYALGVFRSNSIDCIPGSGTFNLNNPQAATNDFFLAKYDPNGNFIWGKNNSNSSEQSGWDMKMDADFNIYITGTFVGTCDFMLGAGTYNLSSFNSYKDAFIAKYDSAGTFQWAKQMGGSLDDEAYALALDDNNNIYLTGYFTDSADFDPGAGVHKLYSHGSIDIFVSKFDPSGNLLWANAFGAESIDQGTAITCDQNSVFVSGLFIDTVDFDPGPGISNLIGGPSLSRIFIARYDLNGAYDWKYSLGGGNTSIVKNMDIDQLSNIYLFGRSTQLDLDPGPGSAIFCSSANADVFMASYHSSGNYRWGAAFGKTGIDYGEGGSVTPEGNVLFTGKFSGTSVDFDPGPTINALTCTGFEDCFFGKYNQVCVPSYDSVSASICEGTTYSLPDGNTADTTGSYTSTLTSMDLCDSVIITNLVVFPPPDTGITVMTPTCACPTVIVADSGATSYQWLNCNTGYSIIPGATSQSFIVPADGNYAVMVTTNSCTDTSACYYVLSTGIEDQNIISLFVYPNPAASTLHISFDLRTSQELSCNVCNVLGQELRTFGMQTYAAGSSQIDLDLTGLNNGFYYIKMKDGKQEKTIRFIVNQ